MKTKIFTALAAGVLLLGACKGSGVSKYEANDKASGADTVGITQKMLSDTVVQAKLIKTADMRFKVKNVQQTAEKITTLTMQIGGTVVHHQMQSTPEGSQDIRISDDSVMHVSSFNAVADMTVDVPPSQLEGFMNQVAQMGIYIDSRKMNIDDKGLDYLTAKLKLKNREEAIAKQDRGKTVESDPSKNLMEKDDIVDRKISNLKVDKDAKYSTVILSFYQNKTVIKEVVANDDPSAYQLSLSKRLINSLGNGWALFAELVINLANAWAFILGVVVLWVLFRYYKRKHPAFFGTIKS